MIEMIQGLPSRVIGIHTRGRITGEECEMLRWAIEDALVRHPRLRLYYEIGARFPGAGCDELEIPSGNLPDWERVAIVTDSPRVHQTVKALRLLIAGDVRVFTDREVDAARAWIARRPRLADRRRPDERRYADMAFRPTIVADLPRSANSAISAVADHLL
jgi:hypothetical protein